MINYVLKVDYALSTWFSKKKDTVVSGTSYLFLGKVIFVLVSLLTVLDRLFNYEVEPEVFTVGVMLVLAIVYYSLEKPIEKLVEKRKLKAEYLKIKYSQVLKRRCVGLLMFTLFFLCQFLAVFL